MFEMFWQDVRYAARSLRRSRGFTAASVLTLAAGIGLTTAVYSVVDAVLVEPIPLADHDRLVVVWETDRDTSTAREPASYPDFLDFKQRSREVSQFAAFSPAEVNFTPDGAAAARLASVTVSGDFFSLLGVQPLAGRLLTAADENAGAPDVVVISEQLWELRFDRDTTAVGQTMRLNGRLHTIVGVAPRAAAFGIPQVLGAAAYAQGFIARDRGADIDVWRPLRTTAEASPRATHGLMLLGRMGPGTSAVVVQQELATIAADLERTYPENEARGINVEFLDTVVIGPVRPALLVLLLAVSAYSRHCEPARVAVSLASGTSGRAADCSSALRSR